MTRRPIAVFQHDLRVGGAERMMVNLATEWSRRGIPTDLVLVRREGIYLPLVPPSVRIVDLAARRSLASLPALVRYLRAERPRALLSGLVHINTLAILAKPFAPRGTRFVLSERNTPTSDIQDQTLTSRICYRLAPQVYPRADAIIAVSAGVADDLAASARLPRAGIHVVNNPVVTDAMLTAAREPFDHPWFADGAPPVILGVGRLADAKDFATLIRAFAALRARRLCRLMILGEGGLRAGLTALADGLGVGADVCLFGEVLNPYAAMARANLLVLSSRWEGSPNVLVEAMACGLPVVSTDCPSGPRETLAGGLHGPLVPVGDAGAMAEAMEGVLAAPPAAARLRERARDFHVSTAASRYLEILEPCPGAAAHPYAAPDPAPAGGALDAAQDSRSDCVPTSRRKLA